MGPIGTWGPRGGGFVYRRRLRKGVLLMASFFGQNYHTGPRLSTNVCRYSILFYFYLINININIILFLKGACLESASPLL